MKSSLWWQFDEAMEVVAAVPACFAVGTRVSVRISHFTRTCGALQSSLWWQFAEATEVVARLCAAGKVPRTLHPDPYTLHPTPFTLITTL